MDKRYFILIAIYIGLLVVFGFVMPQEENWSPDFSSKSDLPFGSEVLYRELTSVFPDTEISQSVVGAYHLRWDTIKEPRTHLIIDHAFGLDELDTRELLNFVARGNTCFIAAAKFRENFIDTLGLNLQTEYFQFIPGNFLKWQDTVTMHLKDSDQTWAVKAGSEVQYFEPIDSTNWTVLGTFDSLKCNFTMVPFGLGKFYLHSYPYLFTNYYFLKSGFADYTAVVFSQITPETLIWDEYYKPGRAALSGSPLATLMQMRGMRWAYWIALILLVIFFLFHIKRKQRMIPVLSPPRNKSLEFVTTLGDLYFRRGDHQDIAEKKIMYWRDQMQRQYGLSDLSLLESEIALIAQKTGKKPEAIGQLLRVMRKILDRKPVASEQTLIHFNKLLDKFYLRA